MMYQTERAGTKIACEGKLFGTIISGEEFLVLTADQLRQIVVDHNHVVVRRPDGSLASFNPEWLSCSSYKYYTKD
jgi:hypothetical protein